MDQRIVASLRELPVEELGESSVAATLSTLLRVSRTEANRRVTEGNDLGLRSSMSGELLAPLLSNTAAAQLRGDIGFEQVKIIREFFTKLPGFVDHDTREAAEAQLAELACGLGPEQLRKPAERLAMILDQHGDLSDADRAKRSYIHVGQQRRDGMRPLRGSLDPEAGALWEAVAAACAHRACATPTMSRPV